MKDKVNRAELLYKYNLAYFKPGVSNYANPQLITVAFRYVTIPSSPRLLNNFAKSFDFSEFKKKME